MSGHAEPTRDIRALLEQRGVLIFPEVGFTAEEQIAFTRTLGDYVSDLADGGVTPITVNGCPLI